MNYYTFQTNDYAKCTSYLSFMEDLAYRRMLDLYYVTELPLILDTNKIAKRIGMVEYTEEVEYILSEYFYKTDDGFYNRRCEKEIKKYHEKVTRAKRAIKSRWNPTKKTRSNIIEKSDTKRNTDKIPTNNNINNKKNINNNKESTKEKSLSPLEMLLQISVEKQVAKDWIKLRTTQKAPVTGTVIRGFVLQASKAKLTLNEVLIVCIEKSWRGFKAEWLEDKGNGEDKPQTPDWRYDRNLIREKGVELGLPMNQNEDMKEYRTRLIMVYGDKP